MGNSSIDFSVCSSTQVYVSLPTEDGTLGAYLLDPSKTFRQVARADLYKMDGTGWIPLNLSPAALGNVLSKLPTDPQQFYDPAKPSRNYFYTFSCDTTGKFEINAKTESRYYGFTNRDGFAIYNAAVNNAPIADGGDDGLIESGNSLTLMLDSGLCPVAMVWVPSPAMVCLDRYEASYGSGHTVAGVDCSNCALSQRNVAPKTTIDYYASGIACSDAGKALVSDFEWWVAAAGTPDDASCNTASICGGAPCNTGNNTPNCVSSVGAYDMIGNVWEWVLDRQSGSTYSGSTLPATSGYITSISDKGVPLTVSASTPSPAFNGDYYWSGGADYPGLRSGNWVYGSGAGRFALHLGLAPGNTYYNVGFRCALRQ